MGDLKTENTSYPVTLDTRTLIADTTDDVVAAHINGLASAIIALETELGVNPSGTVADVVTRLAVNIHDDGGVLRGTVFPVSPPVKPHLFWRTDLKQLYIYDSALAQYQRIDSTNVHASLSALSADDHTQYVHNTVARTITAQHTFNPGSALPPFILHANAQGQKVIGLDAETVDGKNPGSASGLATLNASSLVVEDPANAQATKTAGKICKWGTSEAFQCSALTATTINGTTVTGSGAVQGTQLISTVATGTAPLSVMSTTAVGNLHVAVSDSLAMTGEADGGNTTNDYSLSMGSATSGDRILICGFGQVSAGTLPTSAYLGISNTGTGAFSFFNSISAPLFALDVQSTSVYGSWSAVAKVTSTGTITIRQQIAQTGGSGNNYLNQIYAFFLKRA